MRIRAIVYLAVVCIVIGLVTAICVWHDLR